jgi:hypothetical protein
VVERLHVKEVESMTPNRQAELELRILEQALQIWIDEGRPRGRDKEHWELAKLAIAGPDLLASSTLHPDTPSPIEAVLNQD